MLIKQGASESFWWELSSHLCGEKTLVGKTGEKAENPVQKTNNGEEQCDWRRIFDYDAVDPQTDLKADVLTPTRAIS